MQHQEQGRSSHSPIQMKRKGPISLSQQDLVASQVLLTSWGTPLLLRPNIDGVNLLTWAAKNRDKVLEHLQSYGALLFRNFNIKDIAKFEQLIKTLASDLLTYSYRSTPRNKVEGNIYTSTEYPSNQSIPLHNEMSYARQWPMKIGFFCITAAEQGGETPIADSRKVFAHIDPQVRETFMQKKVMYVRNYGAGLDIPWQTVFQTNERAQVESFCHDAGIVFEWKGKDGLRTRQVCQAVASHPVTGDLVWFNQAHLFHISSLAEDVSTNLLATFREEDLPRNAYYGDGSPIEADALASIRAAYQQETIVFPWQEGDIMLLDNMFMAHGRTPFSGQRRVVVGMAEPHTSDGF